MINAGSIATIALTSVIKTIIPLLPALVLKIRPVLDYILISLSLFFSIIGLSNCYLLRRKMHEIKTKQACNYEKGVKELAKLLPRSEITALLESYKHVVENSLNDKIGGISGQLEQTNTLLNMLLANRLHES